MADEILGAPSPSVNAAQYNIVQSQVSSVLGTGSGTTGYGQAVLSSQVAAGTVVSALQWTNLRTDLGKARSHQTGIALIDGLASIAGNVGTPWGTLQSITNSTSISQAILNQYTSFGTAIVNNAAAAAASQLTSATGISTTTRATAWGSPGALSITHTVTVTFGGYTSGSLTVSAANHMRVFFNAGGSLQVVTSLAGGSSAVPNTKDADWKNMLIGYVSYNIYNTSGALGVGGTVNSPGSVSTATGFTSLSASPVTVLTQASSYSKYLENRYTIAVAKPTTNTMTFTMTFTDNDVGDQVGLGAGVDESITGTITSTVNATRATGSYVNVPIATATSTAL